VLGKGQEESDVELFTAFYLSCFHRLTLEVYCVQKARQTKMVAACGLQARARVTENPSAQCIHRTHEAAFDRFQSKREDCLEARAMEFLETIMDKSMCTTCEGEWE
jgi:hypothetical protein